MESIKKAVRKITVEPLVALYILPSVLSGLAVQNLNLEKACRVNLNYTAQVCDALARRETFNYTMEEKEVQKAVAFMAGWKTIIQSGIPCLLILFWGSWSDRHGKRKPCMLVPITGEVVAAIGLILCSYYQNVPMEVVGLVETLPPGLTGGWFTMLMGVFSYVADITSEQERTLRIGIVNLCFSLSVPIGMGFSGILLKQIGFIGMFSLSASMYILALFYGYFVLKETTKQPSDKIIERKGLVDFFQLHHVVQTFRVAFKNDENQRRIRVVMLFIAVIVVIGPMHGEMSVMYLFTRLKFNWSEIEFSLFSTYSMLVNLVGTLFSVGLFSHVLKFHDAIIGVMSSMSKILSSFVYAFAQNQMQFLIGPIVEILNGTSFIAMRSMASKLVEVNELGKINSLFGVAEALTPLIYAPIYTQIYSATIDVLPGSFFLLGGILTVPAVIIFAWMYKISRLEKVKDSPKTRRRSYLEAGKTIHGITNRGFVKDSTDL